MPLPIFETDEAFTTAIAEADRADYAKHDGKIMHVVAIDAIKAKAKQAEILGEKATETAARIKAEGERDTAVRTAEQKKAGLTDEQIEQLRVDDAKKREPLEKRANDAEAETRRVKDDLRLTEVLTAAGVMPERMKAAKRALLTDHVEYTETGAMTMKGFDGKPITATLEEFAKGEFKTNPESKFFYKFEGGSGSGAEHGESNSDTKTAAAPSKTATAARTAF